MSIVSLRVSVAVRTRFKPGATSVFNSLEYYSIPNEELKDDDTYLVVFGPHQHKELEVFEKEFKGKVLHKSLKATNTNHPGTGPRNTLIIFEKA